MNNLSLKSIRSRIIIPLTGLKILFIILSAIILFKKTNNFLEDQIKDDGDRIISNIINAIESTDNKSSLRRLLGNFAADKSINYIYLINKDNKIFVSTSKSDEDRDLKELLGNNFSRVNELVKKSIQSKTTEAKFLNNNNELISTSTFFSNLKEIDNIKLEDIHIILSIDGKHASDDIFNFTKGIGGLFLIIFFLSSFSLYFLISYYIIKPIQNLVAFIKLRNDENFDISSFIEYKNYRSNEMAILGQTLFMQVEELNFQRFSILEKNKFLNSTNEKLKEASIVKQIFLANMSHEIRTPLNGIIGITDLLTETTLTAEQDKYLQMIRASGKSLLAVVNDILDFSMIEAKKMTIETRRFSLNQLVKNTFDIYNNLSLKNNIKIEYEIDLPNETFVESDSFRIQQVLNNLLSNAIKFTEKGFISVKIAHYSGERKGNFIFQIKDTGIGMTSEQIQKLFSPFEQTDGSITRKYGGTGLGLVISKNIIEILGGEIWLDSQRNIGTNFYFTLELKEAPHIQNNQLPLKSKTYSINHHLKILLVDDNNINCIVAKNFLSKRFSIISEKHNGEEAYEFCINESPDIIFMDLQMPVMDGKTSVSKIREYEKANSLTPVLIVALSAHVLKEEIEETLKCGFNYYLTKPITATALNELIDIILKA